MTNVIEIYNAPRGKAGRIAIPRWLMWSPIWHEASLETKACFVEIAALFNGHNNGQLKFGVSSAALELGISRARARKALSDLQSLGLAEDLSGGERKPATWRLVHLYCDVTGKPAVKPWESAAAVARWQLALKTYPWTGDQVDAVFRTCVLMGRPGEDTSATAEDRAYADAALKWIGEVFPQANLDDLKPGPDMYATIAGYLTKRKIAHPSTGFFYQQLRAA